MLDQECELAVEAVRLASRISRAVQAEITPGRWDKEDRTPVTVADLAVQALISGLLRERYPQDALMAEEGADELRQPKWAGLLDKVVQGVHLVRPDAPSPAAILDWIERGQQPIDPAGRYWVLDPIDGTKGFLRKEQYAIALALIERGKILLGVLGCPNLPLSLKPQPVLVVQASRLQPVQGIPNDIREQAAAGGTPAPQGDSGGPATSAGQIYVAVQGGGAECLGLESGERTPIHVSAEQDPALAAWCERVESSGGNKDMTAQIVDRVGIVQPPFRIDSQAKYAVVARGEAALYLRHTLDPTYREKVWDHAAGVLLVEEAGGKTTDLLGRPLDFSQGRQLSGNRGIVSTSGLWHDRVLTAAQSVLGLPTSAVGRVS